MKKLKITLNEIALLAYKAGVGGSPLPFRDRSPWTRIPWPDNDEQWAMWTREYERGQRDAYLGAHPAHLYPRKK